jgi:preprotein translocase subunit SecE
VADVKQDNRVVHYFKETRAELKKVNWPTRREARNLTIIVLAVTFAMTVVLGLVFDPVAAWLFKGILVDRNPLQIFIGIGVSIIGLVALVIAMRRQ